MTAGDAPNTETTTWPRPNRKKRSASNTTAWANCACPADALWGAQTQRAVENFPISGRPLPRGFIRALGLIKASAADVNVALGLLPKGKARAIRAAALEVAAGQP